VWWREWKYARTARRNKEILQASRERARLILRSGAACVSDTTFACGREVDLRAIAETERDAGKWSRVAHLWKFQNTAWLLHPLDRTTTIGDATLARATDARWILLGPPHVRVNGAPLAAGLAVLRDRDELWIDGARIFFSTETRATCVPCPAGDRAFRCPRCTTPIAAGSAAVACPRCGVWHHENDERRCWTYSAVCSSCDHPTALDAPYRFDPAVLL
jgi:hypothetical protein